MTILNLYECKNLVLKSIKYKAGNMYRRNKPKIRLEGVVFFNILLVTDKKFHQKEKPKTPRVLRI